MPKHDLPSSLLSDKISLTMGYVPSPKDDRTASVYATLANATGFRFRLSGWGGLYNAPVFLNQRRASKIHWRRRYT